MKGDRVEVVVAADDGSRTYEIVATRAGRRVEITTGRGIVEVVEVTRTGEPVRTARFMASRVVALVEHPAGEAGLCASRPIASARTRVNAAAQPRAQGRMRGDARSVTLDGTPKAGSIGASLPASGRKIWRCCR